MPNLILADLANEIEANVRRALAEDIGSGDITAQLIPAERLAHAKVITRESASHLRHGLGRCGIPPTRPACRGALAHPGRPTRRTQPGSI